MTTETPDLRAKVQDLIDTMINPAVAGHGGFVELVDIQDNRVYLTMGGRLPGLRRRGRHAQGGHRAADQGRDPRGARGPRRHRPLAGHEPLLLLRQGVVGGTTARAARRPGPRASTSRMPRLLLLLPTSTYRTEDFVDAAHRPRRRSRLRLGGAEHVRARGPRSSPDGRLHESRRRRGDRRALRGPTPAGRRGRRGRPHGRRRRRDRRAPRAARQRRGRGHRRARQVPDAPVPGRRGRARAALPPHRPQGRSVPRRARRRLPVRAEAAGAVGEPRRDPCRHHRPVHGGLPAHRRAARAATTWRSAATPRSTCWPSSTSPASRSRFEGLLVDGTLHMLALFDKPDPLDGPFFEETLYVTPSRLPAAVQDAIAPHDGRRVRGARPARGAGARRAARERRRSVDPRGRRALDRRASARARCASAPGMTLEEIILRHALGLPDRLAGARGRRRPGVMMLPIPRAGTLRAVHGAGGRGARRRHRGRGHHRARRSEARAAPRGLAVPRLHLRARRAPRRRRAGAPRRDRSPEVLDRLKAPSSATLPESNRDASVQARARAQGLRGSTRRRFAWRRS